jgi:hypothetical protein
MSFVSRYKPKPRAIVFNDWVVDEIWKKAADKRKPILGGEILDLIYGNSPDKPDNAHEAVRQLNRVYRQKYGRELMSTTAFRQEGHEDEKYMRRPKGRPKGD